MHRWSVDIILTARGDSDIDTVSDTAGKRHNNKLYNNTAWGGEVKRAGGRSGRQTCWGDRAIGGQNMWK